VRADIPLGGAPFADDAAPRDALVAVPLPPGSEAEHVDAAGMHWVVGASLLEARTATGKVQGRRTTAEEQPPLFGALAQTPSGGVRLATSWVEPAYLEPDASWCTPGGEPASPLANGGAFGGKERSLAPLTARELADQFGRTVRVVYAREDVVRMGPKRPPIAAVAVNRAGTVDIQGMIARGGAPRLWPAPVDVRAQWTEVDVAGPPVGPELRAAGLAEQAMLVAGALGRNVDVLTPSGARARAAYDNQRVHVQLAAGDPLDEVVLRSYAIGAAHMALGFVLSEGLAVDDDGDVHDLTIRSFGIRRASEMPPIDIEIVRDDAPARARSTDAVFGAVAAATWLAHGCPDTLPLHAR